MMTYISFWHKLTRTRPPKILCNKTFYVIWLWGSYWAVQNLWIKSLEPKKFTCFCSYCRTVFKPMNWKSRARVLVGWRPFQATESKLLWILQLNLFQGKEISYNSVCSYVTVSVYMSICMYVCVSQSQGILVITSIISPILDLRVFSMSHFRHL